MSYNDYAETYLKQRYYIRGLVLDSEISRVITGEKFVINYLSLHDSPVFPKELCENMKTSTARIAAILRHLEKEKLVSVSGDPTDGRRHSIRLNEDGMKVAASIKASVIGNLSKIFEKLGKEDTEEYLRITQKIINICSEEDGES